MHDIGLFFQELVVFWNNLPATGHGAVYVGLIIGVICAAGKWQEDQKKDQLLQLQINEKIAAAAALAASRTKSAE